MIQEAELYKYLETFKAEKTAESEVYFMNILKKHNFIQLLIKAKGKRVYVH